MHYYFSLHGGLLGFKTVIGSTAKFFGCADGPSCETARVINVVSGGMYAERLNLKRLNTSADGYRGARAYAQCKRALSVMTEIWANRGKTTTLW